MSLHFVIDAYNLIRSTSIFQSDDPKELINFIIANNPQGSLNNQVTLVFDGFPDLSFRIPKYPGLEVKFSRNIKADAVIKEILIQDSQVRNLVVITNDREIVSAAKINGAKSISTQEFLKQNKSAKKTIPGKCSDDKGLTYTQMHKINQELKEIWFGNKRNEK